MITPQMWNPAPIVPPHGIMFGALGTNATAVTPATPLPVATLSAQTAATSSPLSGEASTPMAAGPFVPDLGRPMILTLSGDWTGSVQLLRSADGGATRWPLTIAGNAWGRFSSNVNEPVWEESEALATFYLVLAVTSGRLSYRIAQ